MCQCNSENRLPFCGIGECRYPVLKDPGEDRAAVIVVRDIGGGAISMAMILQPAPAHDEQLTPAQSFASHAYGVVKDMLDDMCEKQLPAEKMATMENVERLAKHSSQLPAKSYRIGSPDPRSVYKPPLIMPGETKDLEELKRRK